MAFTGKFDGIIANYNSFMELINLYCFSASLIWRKNFNMTPPTLSRPLQSLDHWLSKKEHDSILFSAGCTTQGHYLGESADHSKNS